MCRQIQLRNGNAPSLNKERKSNWSLFSAALSLCCLPPPVIESRIAILDLGHILVFFLTGSPYLFVVELKQHLLNQKLK